jgi:hypothetical protein
LNTESTGYLLLGSTWSYNVIGGFIICEMLSFVMHIEENNCQVRGFTFFKLLISMHNIYSFVRHLCSLTLTPSL